VRRVPNPTPKKHPIMTIIRTVSPKYFAPVTHKCLAANGLLQELKFDVQFKRLKQSERDALIEANALKRKQIEQDTENGINTNTAALEEIKELLRTYACGWKGVQEEDKTEVPFSHEALFDLCEDYSGLLVSVANAFWESFNPTTAAHLATKN